MTQKTELGNFPESNEFLLTSNCENTGHCSEQCPVTLEGVAKEIAYIEKKKERYWKKASYLILFSQILLSNSIPTG